MKHQEIEAPAERLLARSNSRLSCDQPELQRDLKMAASLTLLVTKLPDVDIDVLPSECGSGYATPALTMRSITSSKFPLNRPRHRRSSINFREDR
jgi:hypothetical protein